MSDLRQRDNQTGGAADPVKTQVIAPLRHARLEPDDLQLARLGAALDSALQEAAKPKTAEAKPVRRRVRWVGGGALAVAAVAALAVGPWMRRAPQPHAQVVAPARTALAIAREDGVAPAAAGPRALVVPAGGREQGRIGDRVRFTLVGPGEVSAFGVVGGTELDLAGGRLLVEYDGNGEDILRVRSPGAVTTVVGTLFAVEARGRASRVAVARGAVTVESVTAGIHRIAAGRSWLTETLETEPLPSDVAADLAAHDRAAVAPSDRAPLAQAEVRPRRAARPAPGAPDADVAYAAAEDLMRAGSATAARRALLDLVAAHPGDPRAELALLDLARLALAAGHPVEARGYLKRLLGSTDDAALIDLGRQIQRRIDAAAAP
jgi:hypothetical protein